MTTTATVGAASTTAVAPVAGPVPGPAPGRSKDPLAVLSVIGLLIGVVILLTGALMLLKRRYAASQGVSDQTGLVMDELRSMRERGALSEEEYEAARAKLRDRLRGQALGGSTPPEATDSTTTHPDATRPRKNPTSPSQPRQAPRPSTTQRPRQGPSKPDKPSTPT
ncbi:MAG: SHOCT domain-containing protein [Phycisphaerales bacterium]|nr:SHOCT domain-containing protein [Phycisphaerales bacterium]